MMLPPLTLIPAGAGSGKTYSIQQQLGEWVIAGKIAPQRIVAVTFTEAAAAELRERIRAKLLGLGHLEDALKLDQAYISTIHGFGLRLLTEFAFDAGLSPRPRLLNEDEENTLIRLALARTDKADEITSNLARYGYGYEFMSGKGAEDVFRDVLLDTVMQLRSVGWREDRGNYAEQAAAWISRQYGPVEDAERLTARLRAAVKNLLEAFPDNLSGDYGTSATAASDFGRDFRNLRNALRGDVLESDWKLWQQLRELRQSKRGTPLPEVYDQLAANVIAAADALPRHPGPRLQAMTQVKALLAAGQEVLEHYAQAKREAGLVDYGDMIALAGEMLRNRPDVLATLVSRIDCLVVDEFQDTNPLQFALLWQLKEAGVPTVIVGDLKQAIMGFQGADPRLFAALMQQNPEVSKPLTQNWRSQPRLMDFVNAVGPVLFGQGYQSLEPRGTDSLLGPLELISFSTKAKKDQHRVRATAVGQRLAQLLADEHQQIVDRRTKIRRRLRGGDLAVLCPTHHMLAEYASVLRAQGLRVRLQEDGWYSSRIVQLVLQALAYVANPGDRHAALYLAVTELGSLGLKEALDQLMTAGQIGEPLLARLDGLAQGVADRTVYALVADTLSVLNLFDAVALWPDAEQARANLLRLLAEAGEFMDANREALASGGFHGAGVQSFLAWLAVKVERKDKNNQPDPRVIDEDAIELVTWHSAKGREWPVVCVCGMDRPITAKLPTMALGYRSFDELSELLEQAQIEYSPKFAASESDAPFLASLSAAAEIEARRLLYVAITRARDKLILEWPEYLEGKAGLTCWSILTSEQSLSLHKGALQAGGVCFPCTLTQGGAPLPDELDWGAKIMPALLSTRGRLAIRRQAMPQTLTPESITPSQMPKVNSGVPAPALESVKYQTGLDLELDLGGAELGTALHRCFEVLGVNAGFVERLPAITGVDFSATDLQRIAASVVAFEQWLEQYFAVQLLVRELPLLGLDEQGSVISGTADLVVTTPAGIWIIDHKSDLIEDPQAAFLRHQPQLECYAKALAGTGCNVLGVAIHWIRRGEVTLAR